MILLVYRECRIIDLFSYKIKMQKILDFLRKVWLLRYQKPFTVKWDAVDKLRDRTKPKSVPKNTIPKWAPWQVVKDMRSCTNYGMAVVCGYSTCVCCPWPDPKDCENVHPK